MSDVQPKYLESACLKRFYINLEKDGVTRADLEKNYRYAGGDQGRHLNYFHLVYRGKNMEMPPHHEYCYCETPIVENCFLASDVSGRILVVGNCCIKRFMPEGVRLRTCERCGEPHQNRVVNRCQDCRRGLCDRCDAPIPKHKAAKICDTCRFGHDECKYCEAETPHDVDVCDACKLLKRCKECDCVIAGESKYCAECKDPRCKKCDATIERGLLPRICDTCRYGHCECFHCKTQTPYGIDLCDDCERSRICRQCKATIPGNRLKTIDLCDTCRFGHAECQYCKAETPYGVVVCARCKSLKRCELCKRIIDVCYTRCYKCQFSNKCKKCGKSIAVKYETCFGCKSKKDS